MNDVQLTGGKKTWAELAEQEEEELEQELENQRKQKQEIIAGNTLTNFQKRLINKVKSREGAIPMAISRVPKTINKRDLQNALNYKLLEASFKQDNYFFKVTLDDAINLISTTDLTINCRLHKLSIIVLPITNL